MAPKRKTKMTWEKLANDPTISKSELPRIAKAFGLKKPEDVPAGAKRSRVAGGYKAPAKKAAVKKAAAQKEPAAISSKRQRAVAPKAKAKAKPTSKFRVSEPGFRRGAVPATAPRGTETAFEEGGKQPSRIKRTSPGGRARGTAAEGKLVKAKQAGAVDLWTGSAARGQRRFAPKQGPTVYRPRRKK